MKIDRLAYRRSIIVSISVSMLAFFALLLHIEPVAAADSVRITTSFEAKYTEAVLRQVARVVDSGFTRGDADRLAREIDGMKADQPMTWQLQVAYQGGTHPLQLRALLDDLGMVDLDFTTTAALAPALRAAVDGYLNARIP
jgi:hypothetical protein